MVYYRVKGIAKDQGCPLARYHSPVQVTDQGLSSPGNCGLVIPALDEKFSDKFALSD
jgi:hypothetical protein